MHLPVQRKARLGVPRPAEHAETVHTEHCFCGGAPSRKWPRKGADVSRPGRIAGESSRPTQRDSNLMLKDSAPKSRKRLNALEETYMTGATIRKGGLHNSYRRRAFACFMCSASSNMCSYIPTPITSSPPIKRKLQHECKTSATPFCGALRSPEKKNKL